MKFSNLGSSYVGSSHWAAVLGGIAELKDLFEEEEPHVTRNAHNPLFNDATGPQLLCGSPQYASKEEILAAVPERSVADRLLSSFFNTFEMHSG